MNISRRNFLVRTTVVAGAATAALLPFSEYLASPAHAAEGYIQPKHIREAARRALERGKRTRSGKPGPNGWEMEIAADRGGSVWTRPVPGTPIKGVAVRTGDVEAVLVHVVRRFHYEVEALRDGDVVGWRRPGEVRRGQAEANQASGTAVQIRPDHYPSGARGGFFPQQQIVLRDILAELEGVVRWGGDETKADESLFYIGVKPEDPLLAKVGRKLRGWSDQPGKGAGGPVDVRSGGRRREAKALAREQKASA
ncbi:twin-arginine translocation signal domain-containing protein [Streptomyces sp. CA-278952]|uniref:twin-arginine translocation signal domain-containing protein n=1 Tax=unclassified Streptomyces TaxID=2593676 RepID=UPI002241C261|nr:MULTISPECIES: twin-arginine translocation signal domain-containing protein [unclassified Streptomyces]UZI29162.1 twin-arginine translocation signal domain-containing protein [Streptomyces sp. VB1]WDG29116.1 twin-arginine translocation signal domain-containing protein [Streptomyces sp. CA-278952]